MMVMEQRKISRFKLICATLGLFAVNVGCINTQSDYLLATADNSYYRDTKPAFPQFLEFSEDPKFVFDFSEWDIFLQEIVIDFGPSERVGENRGDPEVGTRILKGHQTRHRLEGNRIAFSIIKKDKELFTLHRENLEFIGNQFPLKNFSKASQVAFWMNLHNSIVLDEIAQKYPVRYPSEIKDKTTGLLLDEKKVTTINGVALSLHDIRFEIVYRLMPDPLTIYGFFMGDLSGPEINQNAYTEENLEVTLKKLAGRYINSLRGVTNWGTYIKISSLYDRNRQIFDDWPIGLRRHLAEYANEMVLSVLNRDLPIRFQRYDKKVADLAGGQVHDTSHFSGLPADALRLLDERRLKLDRLNFKRLRELRRRRRDTEVIVEDPEN